MVTMAGGPMTYIPSTMDPAIASRVANATFTSKFPLQPDDAADSLLMHCCAALTAVGNRALCPKELAELCMQRGWTCSGSQPFAIISSAIRGHLRRRGITTSNASNGLPPGSGRPAPLFTSYELTGPVAAEDVTAIGIVRDEKPAIKRGTLWYLSVHGTGFASPFALGRDPVAHLKHLTHAVPPPPATSGIAHATPPSPERMPTRRGNKPSFIYQAAIAAEAEEPDSMGRGKRKRKASGIAGGEWESIALPSTSVTSTPTVAAPTTSFSSSLARIPEEPTVSSGPPPPPRPASTSVVKLKLKLSAPSATAKPTRPLSHLLETTLAPSSDDETGDELEEADLARRKRLRFQPGLHSPASTSYRNPRPAFSASTSVIDDDDSSDDGGEDAREAMRAADFDFAFDHAFSSVPLQSGLAELGQLAIDTNVSTPATTPRLVEDGDQAEDKIDVDGEDGSEADGEEEGEAGDEATSEAEEEEVGVVILRGKERRRAASAGALDAPAPFNIMATLCPARPAAGRERSRSFEGVAVPIRAASEGPSSESTEGEKLASPAPPLPALSVIAATHGFAPAGMQPSAHGEPPCQTPFTQPEDLEYDFALTIGGGSSEPSASVSPMEYASPRSPEYMMAEEGDDFDADALARRSASQSASPYPLAEEDDGVFVSGFGDGMLTSMDLDPPEAVGLDVIDAEFGPVADACLTSTSLPSFGSAASFFTSFLGSASVPVEVVGLRRDSDSSYDSEEVAVESEETEEDDAPPARSTRSRAKRPPPRTGANKRKTRHASSA